MTNLTTTTETTRIGFSYQIEGQEFRPESCPFKLTVYTSHRGFGISTITITQINPIDERGLVPFVAESERHQKISGYIDLNGKGVIKELIPI